MSVKYVPVQWLPNKYVYDAVLLVCVAAYILIFLRLGAPAADTTLPVVGQILRMRAFGTCAFLMLTVILCIGPLARLDRRFLPLLYNRRHFGVLTSVVALNHASYVLGWYFAFSPTPPLEALLSANTSYGQVLGFPFEIFGVFGLIVLGILAATSHDFWLSFLSAPVWKALHLMIYPAYAAVVAHVSLGYMQDARDPTFAVIASGGALAVAALHLIARRKPEPRAGGDWRPVVPWAEIPDKRAVVVRLDGDERAAVFRNGTTLSAVSNACAHQNGPLGEGRIVYGCITCPWHGFQYRPEDGRSPPPFTEKIPTYRLRLDGDMVMIDARANPPGTPVEPLSLPEGA
jgi:nitrite reductase/ring-hydroxylating ferredoxin subunit/DMSO/TMAO reductase YedYZ heme-binding membrane subunit